MHSDLKTKNILLTRNQQTAKIADVGLAQFMGSAYFKSENVAFTLTYAAPELLLNAICSSKVRLEHAAAKPFRMLCDLHKSDLLMLNERACPPACYQVVLWRSAPIAHILLTVFMRSQMRNMNLSAQVDIYSLGVVLWEIVTGELPSRGRLTRVRVCEPASRSRNNGDIGWSVDECSQFLCHS